MKQKIYIGPIGAHPGDNAQTPSPQVSPSPHPQVLPTMPTPQTLTSQTALLIAANPDQTLSPKDAEQIWLVIGDTPIIDDDGLCRGTMPDGRAFAVRLPGDE